jgi:hypothetical protein
MADSTAQLPPYMSFGIFKSTIDTLAESTVPSGPLDRRVLDGLSGADYGSLMSGLKFLGYVDSDRKATDAYRTLVQVSKSPDKFKPALLSILEPRYKPIIGNINLKDGTITELEKAFKDAGVAQGQMLTKTIRFFVKAMQECDVQVSPHITKPRRSPNGAGKKPDGSRKKRTPDEEKSAETPNLAPTGYRRFPIPGEPDAYIQFPVNLTAHTCDIFAGMLGIMRDFMVADAKKEKKS